MRQKKAYFVPLTPLDFLRGVRGTKFQFLCTKSLLGFTVSDALSILKAIDWKVGQVPQGSHC